MKIVEIEVLISYELLSFIFILLLYRAPLRFTPCPMTQEFQLHPVSSGNFLRVALRSV